MFPVAHPAFFTPVASEAVVDRATGRQGWEVIAADLSGANGGQINVIAYCAPLPAGSAALRRSYRTRARATRAHALELVQQLNARGR